MLLTHLSYAEAALGRAMSGKERHRLASPAEVRAAAAERLPSPTVRPNGERAVGFQDLEALVLDDRGAEAPEVAGWLRIARSPHSTPRDPAPP